MLEKNYESWTIAPLNRNQFAQLNLREKMIFLCRLGHLAPSSHNSQPWRFSMNESDSAIDVYADRNFILPASDVAGRQAMISIGCALENMVIGASYLTAVPKVSIFRHEKNSVLSRTDQKNGHSRYVYLARLYYNAKHNPLPLEHLYKSIFTRKVMRAEYDPQQALPSATISQLQSATDGKKTKLHIITDSIRRLSISEFQGQADGFVINSPRFSKELGAWLLPNDTDSYLGMPGAGFGLQNEEALRIHRGLIGESALQPEDGLKFALAGKYGIEKSPFIGCITIPKDEISNWVEAGRSFERMFLILESSGISVAIHAGIVEVVLVNRIFAATLGTLRKPAVLFRAGKAKKDEDRKRPHSPRLPIEDVILTHRS